MGGGDHSHWGVGLGNWDSPERGRRVSRCILGLYRLNKEGLKREGGEVKIKSALAQCNGGWEKSLFKKGNSSDISANLSSSALFGCDSKGKKGF